MNFNRKAFNAVCANSGFTKRELAYIYGTSRQTIYSWASDSMPTQLALAARAAKATDALSNAIKRQLLPLPPALADRTRAARIDVIVKTIMESLTPTGR